MPVCNGRKNKAEVETLEAELEKMRLELEEQAMIN